MISMQKDFPPINTIAYELTDVAAQELDTERHALGLPELQKLRIDNIANKYNYRTIGDNYTIVTSVLSNSTENIPIGFTG
jgi:hypothetical protein